MSLLPSCLGYMDVTFSFVFILLILIWIRSRRPTCYPPGPTPIPIIGNFHNLAKEDFCQTMREMRKCYGDIFTLSLGTFWVVVVNGRDNLHELLTKRGEITADRPPLHLFNLFRNMGIISSSGHQWKTQRSFTLSKLRDFGFGKNSFESRIMEEVEVFVGLVESYNEHLFDLSNIISVSTSNIVMSITVGRRFEYKDPQFKYFLDILNKLANNPAFNGPLNFLPFLSKLPFDLFGGKQITKEIQDIHTFLQSEIDEHKRTIDNNNPRDFIDVYLLELEAQKNSGKNYYTVDNLLAILTDLFAGGSETTATTIRWAILYMTLNMEVQSKMFKEIDDVVGSARFPSLSDKPNLPYCEAVILESLRIGNIVPFSLPHKVSADIYFKGFTIPKDSIIIPSLDSVAFDDMIFEDSKSFKPERFIDTHGKLCGQDHVLTFSLGRRVCLGESLARMELFLYLTSLVQRFKFLPPKGSDPSSLKGVLGITYSPKLYQVRAISRI